VRSIPTCPKGLCTATVIFCAGVLQSCRPAGSDPADFVEHVSSIRPSMSYTDIVTAVPAYYFDSVLMKQRRMLAGTHSATSNDTCTYAVCLRSRYFLFPDGYTVIVYFDGQTNAIGMYYGVQQNQRFADWRPDWGVVVGLPPRRGKTTVGGAER
jgi:hypothetical protein